MSEVRMHPGKAASWILAILVLLGFIWLEGTGMPNRRMMRQPMAENTMHCEKHPGCCEKPKCEKPRCETKCEKPRCEPKCEKPCEKHVEKHVEKPKSEEKPKCGKSCGSKPYGEASSLDQSDENQAAEEAQSQQ